jgi:hypothetical protein
MLRRLQKEEDEERRALEALPPAEREAREREQREADEEERRLEEEYVADFRKEFEAHPVGRSLRRAAGTPAEATSPDEPEPSPGPQGSSNLAAESAAAWDARRQSDKRRAVEEIERVRQGYSPGAPTATVEPPWPSPPKAGESPIDRMKRKSELDQQRRERIDRVMKARAAQSTGGEQGDSGG